MPRVFSDPDFGKPVALAYENGLLYESRAGNGYSGNAGDFCSYAGPRTRGRATSSGAGRRDHSIATFLPQDLLEFCHLLFCLD